MANWLVVARNEYRLRTSGLRSIRRYFPIIVIAIIVLFVGFLAPAFANAVVRGFDLEAFFVSIQAIAMMQAVLFMFFFYFILFPISNTLKDIDTQEYEIFLSAPIKPSQVLLGKFMGMMPFYSIAIIIIVGIFTAFLIPIGMGVVEISIIIAVFVLTLLSAVWIGTVLAGVLRTRLGKSARGRDIGKALPLILALPFVAVMYALMGGGLSAALADPNTSETVRTIMMIFPSSWGAELLVLFASEAIVSGSVPDIILDTLLRFGGLIIFFLASLWVGTKVADRAYSFETTTFSSAIAKPDGAFYRGVKTVGGGKSFGTLLVSITKDYARRFENMSKIAYFVGLLILMNVFFVGGESPEMAFVLPFFLLGFLTVFVVGEVTIRGKESLFLYRKAPGGERRLVLGRLAQGLLVVLPIVAIYESVSLLVTANVDVLTYLTLIGAMMVVATAYVAMSLGLFLMKPVFTDKPAEVMVNAIVMMVISMVLFFISITISGVVFGNDGFYPLLILIFSCVLGASFLYKGKKNLGKIE